MSQQSPARTFFTRPIGQEFSVQRRESSFGSEQFLTKITFPLPSSGFDKDTVYNVTLLSWLNCDSKPTTRFDKDTGQHFYNVTLHSWLDCDFQAPHQIWQRHMPALTVYTIMITRCSDRQSPLWMIYVMSVVIICFYFKNRQWTKINLWRQPRHM